MFPLPLKYYAYIGLVLFGLAGFGYGKYKSYKLDAYIVAQKEVVQKKEQEYQIAADQIRKETNAKIKDINNQLIDAVGELRKRPSRAEQANNGSCGTGTTLSAEDATFLVREAARADEIRTGLEACYQQYDSIK